LRKNEVTRTDIQGGAKAESLASESSHSVAGSLMNTLKLQIGQVSK